MEFSALGNDPQTRDRNEEVDHFRDENEDDDDAISLEASIARKHYRSTAALCLCVFTHSWLLVSVFPYSGFMVIKLVHGTDEENAGSYAGLLGASFMIGRALTSYGWGKIADTYGRKIVFFVSLVLSTVFSLLFGMSSSFGLAFLWRFLLGASNGVAGISKAVVSETAQGNEILERKGMSLSMGMWAWGFLLSPAISGFLSDPVQQYPGLSIWGSSEDEQHQTTIYLFLKSYPFFLPNLVSVFLCVIDMIAVRLLVPETLPVDDLRSAVRIPTDLSNWFAASFTGRRISNNEPDTNTNTNSNEIGDDILSNSNTLETLLSDDIVYREQLPDRESETLLSPSPERRCCSNNLDDCAEATTTTNSQEPPEDATVSYLWSKKDTRSHLIVFWIFSFVAIAIDEAFPLFCISKEGGLGLSSVEIGKLLSATGFFFAASQYHVYKYVVDRYGIRRSIRLGAMLSAPLVAFAPIALLFNTTTTGSSITWASFLYLSLLLSFMRIFGLVFFASIAISVNRTVIQSHRGTMNGLCMLGGSIAKGLGPIVAGLFMSFGVSSGVFAPKVGATLVFLLIGACSAIAAGVTADLLVDSEDVRSNPVQNSAHQK